MKKYNTQTEEFNYSGAQTLTFAIESGCLCHAYMFHGQPLAGKKTVAKHFAKAVLCTGAVKPCGACSSCKKFNAQSHPDFFILGGNHEKNSFHADVVRQLKKKVYTKPNDGEYQIFLLCNVDAMTKTAANALLKILEEPPASSVFLLTCVNSSSIPDTIVSRCISIAVSPPTEAQCLRALEKMGFDGNETIQAVLLSGGNIGQARMLLENEIMKKNIETAISLCKAMVHGSAYYIMAALSRLDEAKSDGFAVLELVKTILINAVKSKWIDSAYNCELTELCSQLNRKITTKTLLELIERIQRTEKKLNQNANIKLTFTWLSSQIQQSIIH